MSPENSDPVLGCYDVDFMPSHGYKIEFEFCKIPCYARAMLNFQHEKVGRVFIVLWLGTAGNESSRELASQLSTFSKLTSNSYMVINIVGPNAPPPNSEERKLNLTLIENCFSDGCHSMHSILLGDSMRISIMRAFMRGISLASKYRSQLRVFGTTEESILEASRAGFATSDALRTRIRELLQRNNLGQWT